MLHTKSQGHRPSGSGEENFLKGFIIYGHCGHLGHVTRTFEQTFVPVSKGVSMYNSSSIGPVVSEEKMFENVDGRRTADGRRSHWYTISSPMSPRLR